MTLTKKDNLIIQPLLTSTLLIDLIRANNQFIESDFFKNMNTLYPKAKDCFIRNRIPIGNEGTILMLLYALLVIPKELIERKYNKEYAEINTFLTEKSINLVDTYSMKNDFLRHIRNAVSHVNIEYKYTSKSKMIIFNDKSVNKEIFSATFLLEDISILIADKLLKIHQQYLGDIDYRNKE